MNTTFIDEDKIYFSSLFNDEETNLNTKIGILNLKGELENEADFSWISINPLGNTMTCSEDKLFILDGINSKYNAINLLVLDKHTLDSLGHYTYLESTKNQIFENNIIIHNDKILLGVTEFIDSNGPIVCFDHVYVIDINTFEIIKIINHPELSRCVTNNYTFVDEDNQLWLYYNKIEVSDKPYSRGFIKYDNNYDIEFIYEDSLNFITADYDFHTAVILNNQHFVYKQRFDEISELPKPEFEILCLNQNLDTIWHNTSFIQSTFGSRGLSFFSKTQDNNILGCGRINWHYNYNGIDFPWPDPIERYEAAYITKIDGETGEKLWEHSIIEYDEFGNIKPSYCSNVYQLDDGSIFGSGASNKYSDHDVFTEFNSWFFILPPDLCENESMECEVKILLTPNGTFLHDIIQEDKLTVYPNPITENLFISFSDNYANKNISYSILDMKGNLIKNGVTSVNSSIDLSDVINTIPNNHIILQLFDEDNTLLHSSKLSKVD